MAGVFFFLDAPAVVDARFDAVGITVVTVFIKFVTVSKGMFVMHYLMDCRGVILAAYLQFAVGLKVHAVPFVAVLG